MSHRSWNWSLLGKRKNRNLDTPCIKIAVLFSETASVSFGRIVPGCDGEGELPVFLLGLLLSFAMAVFLTKCWQRCST